jgi:hypothetical protein
MRINRVFIELTMRFDDNGKYPEKSLLIYNPCRYVFWWIRAALSAPYKLSLPLGSMPLS